MPFEWTAKKRTHSRSMRRSYVIAATPYCVEDFLCDVVNPAVYSKFATIRCMR